MIDIFLNKKKLNDFFSSISNPLQALEIKNNIEETMQYLHVPSAELLEMLEKEGFDPSDFNKAVDKKKIKSNRKVNINIRSFLIENECPVRMLSGRAVSSEIEKGSVVLKYSDMNNEQQDVANSLI